MEYSSDEVLAIVPPFVVLNRDLAPGTPPTIRPAFHQETREPFVAKRITKWRLTPRGMENLRRSISIHSRLNAMDNQGIVKLIALFEDKECQYMFMERMDGDLINLVERRGPLADLEARHVFRRIVETMAFLHNNGACHRDLKPDNFLISYCCSSLDAVVTQVKLTDFELAADLEDEQELSVCCGSPTYAAPEMCRRDRYDGRKTDVWSAGVLLYTLLCGEFPWHHPDLFHLFDLILTEPVVIPLYLSAGARDLLSRMLEKNPLTRASVPGLLSHPWLNDLPPLLGCSHCTSASATSPLEPFHQISNVAGSAITCDSDSGDSMQIVPPSTPSSRTEESDIDSSS